MANDYRCVMALQIMRKWQKQTKNDFHDTLPVVHKDNNQWSGSPWPKSYSHQLGFSKIFHLPIIQYLPTSHNPNEKYYMECHYLFMNDDSCNLTYVHRFCNFQAYFPLNEILCATIITHQFVMLDQKIDPWGPHSTK